MMVHSRRGFTLVEILVAVSILGVISAISYTGLSRALDAQQRLSNERAFWKALSLTFVRMSDDLGQACPRAIRDEDGQYSPPFKALPVNTDGTLMEWTRRGVAPGSGRGSDLQRVAYSFQNGVLSRLTWPQLDRAPSNRPRVSPVLDGIDQIQVRFFNEAAQRVGYWPPSVQLKDELPRGVQITFTMAGRGQIARTFVVNG